MDYKEIPVGDEQELPPTKKFLVEVSYMLRRQVVVEAYDEYEAQDICNTIDVDKFTDYGASDLQRGYNITLLEGELSGHGSGAALMVGECDSEGNLLAPQE